jgi:hypothetical protein
VSGPKRYDWVHAGGSASQYEKQETEDPEDSSDGEDGGSWVYLRDSTRLTDLLNKELDIDIFDTKEDRP